MIAVLGSASWANGSTVDPVSRSFTVPSGTDRLLVVQSPLDATGVTYAGQVMTQAKTVPHRRSNSTPGTWSIRL